MTFGVVQARIFRNENDTKLRNMTYDMLDLRFRVRGHDGEAMIILHQASNIDIESQLGCCLLMLIHSCLDLHFFRIDLCRRAI